MSKYLLEKVIPSQTQRDYLKEVNYQFTDRELASLIYNSLTLSWQEKVTGLYDLSKCTQDVILQKEIAERFIRDDAQRRNFEQSGPDEIIELLYILDDEVREYLDEEEDIDIDKFYFRTVEDAKSFAKKRLANYRYRLFKYRLLDGNGTLKNTLIDAFEYYPDSELPQPLFVEDDKKYKNREGEWREYEKRFEWCEVKYPMPFKDGDVVRCVEGDKYGILRIQKDKERFLARVMYGESIMSFTTGPFSPFFFEIITNVQDVENYEFLQKVWESEKGGIYTCIDNIIDLE